MEANRTFEWPVLVDYRPMIPASLSQRVALIVKWLQSKGIGSVEKTAVHIKAVEHRVSGRRHSTL